MVNHGPSRACDTCKQRRKKCDGAYPYCSRCVISGRVCRGYENRSGFFWRNYAPAESLRPIAPSRDLGNQSVTDEKSLQYASAPAEPEDSEIEENALRTFCDDYCIAPQNPAISRGFLQGVDALIAQVGPGSDMAKAAKLVALAGAANRLQRSSLGHKAEEIYAELLQSYLKSLSSDFGSTGLEKLIVAILLGLYEIIMSCEAYPQQHMPHVRGIGAIIHAQQSPFSLLRSMQLLQLGNPLMIKDPVQESLLHSVRYSAMLHSPIETLDGLIVKLNGLAHRSNVVLNDLHASLEDVARLERDATAFDPEFAAWTQSQPTEWQPEVICTIDEERSRLSPGKHFWPGEVHTYTDFYVSTVWNTHRKARMMLLDIIVQCRRRLIEIPNTLKEEAEAQRLGEEIAATVPFHLILDLSRSIVGDDTELRTAKCAKPVGGLLLIHPLYVSARLSIVSSSLRKYMCDQLRWIGQNMGIGQATLLADPTSRVSFQNMAQGHVLIWAGMLIHAE